MISIDERIPALTAFTAIPISEKESVSALMNEERGVVASMTLNTRFDYVRVGSVPL